jgi:D-aspartate ligase
MNAAETPALLLMAEYNGTLAAARCLARHGVPVVLATSNMLAPARWSRAVSRIEHAPPFGDGPGAVVNWLLQMGRQGRKHVLYPTCDEMAWLLAFHGEALSEYYHLYSPAPAVLRAVLDKRELYNAAGAADIDVPRTWYPQSEDELEQVMQAAKACIVKPRTQTFFRSQAKGGHAVNLQQLREVWHQYCAGGYASEVAAHMPDIRYPMVQELLPGAAQRVYSISGFADRSGTLLDSRASSKILQLPRAAGVGVCFESVTVDAALAGKLQALCRQLGYFGVFEAEFVEHEGRQLLIDFNPRYFGQMAFDIARDMELPWLAHLCALGQEEEARAVARNSRRDGPTYYADSPAVRWYLFMGTLLGGVDRSERMHWRDWMARTQSHRAEAICDAADPAPARAAFIGRLRHALRYPRGLWRSLRSRPALAVQAG